MSPLWTSAALRAATGGSLAAQLDVTGVSIDSRSAGPGDLFVALRDARDGHDFVAAALAQGAAAAMVDHAPRVSPPMRRCCWWARRSPASPRSAPPAAPAPGRASPPSPAASARPAPRRCCGCCLPASARRMPPSPPTTTTGACR
ncbi:Mur ligase domain-containing protein [Paeniroseomonas aquatica]|uniref:Mur ligase domain-containing protein n=1 Tax=Paeniroseomonas aquatica TaxID=373043 RepID=UPI00361ED097